MSIPGDVIIAGSTSATFTGGSTFTGTNATFNPSSAYLYWQQIGTLTGKTLSFGSNGLIYVSTVNSNLTLDPTTTATGDVSIYSDGSTGTSVTNLGSITQTGGSGILYARSWTNAGSITANAGTLAFGTNSAGYNSFNTGTITANGSGTVLSLAGNVANTGTLLAQNSGVLRFTGSNTTANIGTVQLATGGRVQLNGTLDNTAATLNVPTGGSFELLGGVITGGNIAAGALTYTSSNGTLSGAALQGNLTLPNSTYVTLAGGANFTGTNLTLGNSAYTYWQQVGTLTGRTLTFGSGSLIYVSTVNSSLTLDPTTTATGDVSIYSDGSAGTTVINQGSITQTGGSGVLYARSWTNSGSITANAGSLVFGTNSAGYNSFNTGTITANGSGTVLSLAGNVANTGTLLAQNLGVLRFTGSNTTANIGTVQLATGGHVQLNGTLDNTAATLNAPTGGAFELLGGTISGGTIAAGALTYTSSNGTLSGATLQGNLTLPNSSYVTLAGGANFTGTNLTLGNSAYTYWQQVGTLTGKTLTFGSGSLIYVSTVNSSLTLDPTTTATGDVSIYSDGSAGTTVVNQGSITQTGGSGVLYARSWTNSGSITANAGTLVFGTNSAGYNSFNTGTITANGSGTVLSLAGNVANTGTLLAQNSGVLRFTGSNTTANIGTVQLATGGHVQLNGTFDNTAATLNAPTGGAFELLGGTISGGTIAAGALTYTSSNGSLSGATLQGDLTLPNSTYVTLAGGANFTGSNLTLGNSAYTYWQQVGTLTGRTLTFGSGSLIYVSTVNSSLTLDPTTTATGDVSIYSDGSAGTTVINQGSITQTGGSGSLYARSWTNSGSITANAGTLVFGTNGAGYNSFNSGTITANGSGTVLSLAGNVANTGTLLAQNSGVLRFTGSNTTANIGTVQLATGGRVQLNGTLDNTAATLNVPTGGSFELLGGVITGGNIAAGALTYTSSNGTLSGAALQGNLTLPNSTYVTLAGGANFTGTNLTLGNSAYTYWQQVGTLTGKTLTFGSGSLIYVSTVNSSLTLDPTTSATGDISIYSDGSSGTTVTNQGSITHTGGSGSLYARSWTNSGSITANAGTMTLGTGTAGYSFANTATGSVIVNGATVTLQSPLTNAGLIKVQSGTFNVGTNLSNGATGTIAGAGTINGSLAMAGGTLAPGNSVGTLTFASSNFSVTGASTLNIEISGATSDQIVFQNPTSTVNIGAGLLSLSIALLSAPNTGTTFNIMNISSGGTGMTGRFAGLPNSGDTLTASFGPTTYTFNVNYLPNGISLSIPEPSTYALLGAGLALLALRRRTNRRVAGRMFINTAGPRF